MAKQNPAQLNSICILRLSAIGDVCNAVSVVQGIQRQYPAAKITWVIGKVEAALLAGLPGVRFVVFDKKQGKAAYRQLRQALKHDYFDVLLHMQVAFRANLASLCINAARKIGFDWHTAKELHALFMRDRIKPAPRSHVLDGFRQFAKAIGVTVEALGQTPSWQLPIAEADARWAQEQLAATGRHRIFIISPAASKAERNWLPERYAAVADYAAEQGFAVVLCGGPTELERNLSQAILAQAKHPITDLTGKTSLKQLLALLKHASLILAPDTGPAHMAVAVGTPVIGLYGHSNPDRTGPYLFRQYVVEVYHQSLQQHYGKTANQLKWGKRVKGNDIMQKIAVETVTAMFDKVVAEQQL
ncbi:glycosyltransferase family 9 protein [Rheinheimera nanhaiensis]|uniref:Heptosyltransferase I n=1 Tax=Rheinheimera nanhaiensis E407-8 TaxID=562729 RepID=I1DUD7_9GAMM|nr:glycosyltransferase family 9 protein [Rheinheimera nanhaiensis]GAB57665.1 heptosyltransferase I [Rheinheimera nanhaiensis E407-8]